MKHRPGKSQTHVDGLSRLPVDPQPPEDTVLQVRLLEDEEEARNIARELHTATHLGGHALWKLFRDRYSHKAGRRICLETSQSCPQCQLGTDYGHRQKTTGTIQSQGPWETLSIDIVGPLPPDHRHEFLIVFMDCYSKYTILIPSSNHTANTVSEALMRHVIPYFGPLRRLLSDCGLEFISAIWTKLLHSLGIQQVLTSPYHLEGNAINEKSHRTLNNMLSARLLKEPSAKAWVVKVPGIMLTLNAMPHEPHGFSASMIATGREPTLPPDLTMETSPSPTAKDPTAYVETIQQRLRLTHQQMATPPTTNPYQVGSLIFALTTPPERTSKLAPRWKGPYRVCRIPNEYQVVYDDGDVERTIHINYAKPAKFTASDLPKPVPPTQTPRPPLGYLPAGLACRPTKPCAPPADSSVAPRPSSRSCRKRQATSHLRTNQSATRACSSSPAVSQAQPRARSHSRYKKPPCDTASSICKPLQDGPHLSAHHRVQRMPREEGESPLFCQPPPGRPPQRAQPVLKYLGTVNGCPLQDFGPCISLHTAGTRRPPRTDSSSPLHAGHNLDFAALRWGLSPLITPALFYTPGTACSLTRG